MPGHSIQIAVNKRAAFLGGDGKEVAVTAFAFTKGDMEVDVPAPGHNVRAVFPKGQIAQGPVSGFVGIAVHIFLIGL